jgi:hypothetical protein
MTLRSGSPGGLKGRIAPGDAHPYLALFDFLRKDKPDPSGSSVFLSLDSQARDPLFSLYLKTIEQVVHY